MMLCARLLSQKQHVRRSNRFERYGFESESAGEYYFLHLSVWRSIAYLTVMYIYIYPSENLIMKSDLRAIGYISLAYCMWLSKTTVPAVITHIIESKCLQPYPNVHNTSHIATTYVIIYGTDTTEPKLIF